MGMVQTFCKAMIWTVTIVLLSVISVATYDCTKFYEVEKSLGQKCVECIAKCSHPRPAGCIHSCIEATPTSRSRPRRDGCNTECPPGLYCDVYSSNGCSSCDIFCKNHEGQGTTEECKQYCPDVFKALKSTPKSPSVIKAEVKVTDSADPGKVDTWTISQISMTAVILFIVLVLLPIAASLWCNRKRIYKAFRRSPRDESEDKKRSVQCSQEMDELCTNSKTPLTSPSGPITQEETPPAETAVFRQGDLGAECGFPDLEVKYHEMDRPIDHTSRKETY